MRHCDKIRYLTNARSYLFRRDGGTLLTFLLSNILKDLNPTPYLCAICGQHHAS